MQKLRYVLRGQFFRDPKSPKTTYIRISYKWQGVVLQGGPNRYHAIDLSDGRPAFLVGSADNYEDKEVEVVESPYCRAPASKKKAR